MTTIDASTSMNQHPVMSNTPQKPAPAVIDPEGKDFDSDRTSDPLSFVALEDRLVCPDLGGSHAVASSLRASSLVSLINDRRLARLLPLSRKELPAVASHKRNRANPRSVR